MPRIVRTPRAREDLVELWTFIAVNDPAAADRMLDLIDQKLAMLAANPRLGPARPDLAEDVRLFPVGRYLILYREAAGGIEVVRVVHGMRRLSGVV